MQTCLRCEQPFTIGSDGTCRSAPDRGPHESLDPRSVFHPFKPGRFDGRCAEMDDGLMCGNLPDADIHVEH